MSAVPGLVHRKLSVPVNEMAVLFSIVSDVLELVKTSGIYCHA